MTSKQEILTQSTQSQKMTSNNHEHFEEIEIEHNFRTYYANGYVEYSVTECIGGNYEGYDFETLYTSEISDITISDLWYFDEETEDAVEVLGHEKYKEIEGIAEETIRDKFE